VSTCHGFIESGTRARIYHWLQRRALRSFDAIVAVSSPIEQSLRDAGVPPEKISLVPNAYQASATSLSREAARRALGLPDATLIGWVGRLSFEKGLDVALEALARLDRSDAYLVVIGEGQEEPALRNLAQTLGIADRVLWRGAIANAERLFAAFDAFLLSSRTEGTPMVLLEAMAANIPIVATEVGGVPDVIDSSSARLVRAGDPSGIAIALTASLSEPDPTAIRVRRARDKLRQRFDIASWLARYESIYRTVARR
jgi:glycosyltransferase involved in cell wall biosynthesis